MGSDLGANLAFILKAHTQGQRDLGFAASPLNAFLVAQGVETLSLRMERQIGENAVICPYQSKDILVPSLFFPHCHNHPDLGDVKLQPHIVKRPPQSPGPGRAKKHGYLTTKTCVRHALLLDFINSIQNSIRRRRERRSAGNGNSRTGIRRVPDRAQNRGLRQGYQGLIQIRV